jgi:hypothetical protein
MRVIEDPKLTPKELVIGKWHSFNPNYWVFDISTNYITYYTGTKWTVNSINDSIIWFRSLELHHLKKMGILFI